MTIDTTLDVDTKADLKAQANGNKERRAFFVVGPEGTGTNMMAEALVKAGCKHVYEVEEIQPEDDLIVIRRSLPHAHEWPDLLGILHSLVDLGMFYEKNIHVLFTIRDFNASAKSVVRRGYGFDVDQCYKNQKLAIITVGKLLGYWENWMFESTYVTYEAFCLSEGFRKWLFTERLGLPYPADYQIWYANDQYYEDK